MKGDICIFAVNLKMPCSGEKDMPYQTQIVKFILVSLDSTCTIHYFLLFPSICYY